MSTHDLVDPELRAALAVFPKFDDMSAATLDTMRAAMGEMARTQNAQASLDCVRFSEKTLPGSGVRVLLYQPAEAKQKSPGYLHIHGGGLIMGSPEGRHIASLGLVRTYGCTVVSVDYRKAPEVPYPGALEDCLSALKWLTANAAALNVDPARIVIGGESAGGGLAAALAIRARDHGGLPIAFQMLTYPMLDDRTCLAKGRPHQGEYVWTPKSNEFGWRSYLGVAPGTAGVSQYAAPARCENFKDLPPAFIALGSLDLFLEEDIEYARNLIHAGVATELHVYPGAFHAFDLVADAAVSKAFKRDWNSAFERAMR
jgi:triacylglycerol lipase